MSATVPYRNFDKRKTNKCRFLITSDVCKKRIIDLVEGINTRICKERSRLSRHKLLWRCWTKRQWSLRKLPSKKYLSILSLLETLLTLFQAIQNAQETCNDLILFDPQDLTNLKGIRHLLNFSHKFVNTIWLRGVQTFVFNSPLGTCRYIKLQNHTLVWLLRESHLWPEWRCLLWQGVSRTERFPRVFGTSLRYFRISVADNLNAEILQRSTQNWGVGCGSILDSWNFEPVLCNTPKIIWSVLHNSGFSEGVNCPECGGCIKANKLV